MKVVLAISPFGKAGWVRLIFLAIFIFSVLLTGGLGFLAAQTHPVSEVDLSPYSERIEMYRKCPVYISIVDDTGKTFDGVEVKIEQISHQFLFGNVPEYLLFAYAPTSFFRGGRFGARPLPPEKIEEYKALYLDVFNYATIPAFYWKDYEPEKASLPLVDAARKIAEWLNENEVPVKGHTLVWGNPPSVGVPTWIWMKGLAGEWSEVRKALYHRIEREVNEFKGLIHMWDVVNEPIIQTWFEDVGPDFIADAYRLVKDIDKEAILVFNEFGLLNDKDLRHNFMAQTRELLDAGVPIDVIGVEVHLFSGQVIKNHLGSLKELLYALDELADLGKPIHITEFQIPLPAVTAAYGVSAKEAEVLQAEIARIFYHLFFSHPAVEAIVYWNFFRPWQPGSGFLRINFTLKPLYFTMQDLIHNEWKTRAQGKTDHDGMVEFQGFAGRYHVEVLLPEEISEEFTIQVEERTMNEFTLHLSEGG